MIYFDNSATTKPCDEVISELNRSVSGDLWGNPGSIHRLGITSAKAYDNALCSCAEHLDCDPSELIFTSCGTESANTAILGYMDANPRAGRTVISTRTEHKCTLESLSLLENKGYRVIYVNVDRDGKPGIDELRDSLGDDTALLCFTHVNNETGAVLPVDEIIDLKKSICPDAAFYLDCVQSLGKLPLRLRSMGVDMASFSAHKIHGIKGSGLLYVRKGVKVSPLIRGGGQQRGMRSGTQSLPLALTTAQAVRMAEISREDAYSKIEGINRYIRDELTKRRAIINSPSDALPFVLNVAFDNFQSETMLHCLELYDICISTVSACSSRSKKQSYVLEAMGLDRKITLNSVRLSFSRYNTMDEAVRFIEAVDDIYKLYEVRVK